MIWFRSSGRRGWRANSAEHGVAAAIAAGLACVVIPTEMSASHDFSAATVTLPSMQDAVRWARMNKENSL